MRSPPGEDAACGPVSPPLRILPSFSTLNYDRDAPHAHTPQRLTSSLSHTNSTMALFYVCVLFLAGLFRADSDSACAARDSP